MGRCRISSLNKILGISDLRQNVVSPIRESLLAVLQANLLLVPGLLFVISFL